MKTLQELSQTAESLRNRTQTASISAEETFGLIADMLQYIAHMEYNADGLGVRAVYASIEDMEADYEAPIGTNGKPLRHGQLAVIYDSQNSSYAHSGEIYAWQRGQQSATAWINVGNIAALAGQIQQMQSDIQQRVVKVEGKGLSTNDFTNNQRQVVEQVGVRFIDLGTVNRSDIAEGQMASSQYLTSDYTQIFHYKVNNGHTAICVSTYNNQGGWMQRLQLGGDIYTRTIDSNYTPSSWIRIVYA